MEISRRHIHISLEWLRMLHVEQGRHHQDKHGNILRKMKQSNQQDTRHTAADEANRQFDEEATIMNMLHKPSNTSALDSHTTLQWLSQEAFARVQWLIGLGENEVVSPEDR